MVVEPNAIPAMPFCSKDDYSGEAQMTSTESFSLYSAAAVGFRSQCNLVQSSATSITDCHRHRMLKRCGRGLQASDHPVGLLQTLERTREGENERKREREKEKNRERQTERRREGEKERRTQGYKEGKREGEEENQRSVVGTRVPSVGRENAGGRDSQ